MNRRELTEIADKVVRRGIQTVDGVGEVDLVGGQSRQIRVLIDAQRLTAHNLTVTQLRDTIVNENIEEPGGHMIRGPEQVDLRTLGRVTSADQYADVIVAYRGGAPVRVRDVARVEDGAEELSIWAMLGGKDVVSVQVTRQADTNSVQIADEVKRRVESLKKEVPPGRRVASHRRYFHLHQSLGRLPARTSDTRQRAGQHRGAAVHPQPARGADRVGGHSRFGHIHVHADEVYGFHAQQHDVCWR